MIEQQFRLDGQVAVVTGGSGVLGSAMCQALTQAGAKVAVISLSQAPTLSEAIEASGGQALDLVADVLDKTSLEAARERIHHEWGPVDLLLNVAGGNRDGATTNAERSFFELPEADLRAVIDLNLLGTLLPAQVFAADMVDKQRGVILNVSSMASMQPLTRVVGYSAAKAAINNLTKWLAVHMAQEYSPAIRVNAIAPGFFLAEQNRALLLDATTGDLTPRGQTIIDHTPMGRFGEPADLLGTVLWLLSGASRFVTGIVIPVDGGFSAFSGV
jgi:NAD(P)-dependent dehydrogenase (short-subunit alcohol dehydrogenase family)